MPGRIVESKNNDGTDTFEMRNNYKDTVVVYSIEVNVIADANVANRLLRISHLNEHGANLMYFDVADYVTAGQTKGFYFHAEGEKYTGAAGKYYYRLPKIALMPKEKLQIDLGAGVAGDTFTVSVSGEAFRTRG